MNLRGADVNLLFGILALQVDFIDRDQLIEGMQAWAIDKSRSLGEILLERGSLEAHQRELIEQLVKAHLQGHQQDPERSLVALTAAFDVPDELTNIEDGDLEHTLSHLGSGSASALTVVAKAEGDRHFGQVSSDSGRFERVSLHEEGGLGRVWLAQDLELDRKVAIKEMKEQFADDDPSRKRFVMEAEVTGGLEHPGVVPVYGYGTYRDGRPFYAMRFIRGGSLRQATEAFHDTDWSKRPAGAKTVELRRLLSRFLDVCNTIYFAHRRGVLHRDIKPSNIMLGNYGETLVVDWGLAKTMGHSSGPSDSSLPIESTLVPRSGSSVAATVMGSAIGSPPYMSPEQARGEQDQLGPATDIYSLGATLYTLLTNARPVHGSTTEEVLRRVRVGEWSRPRELKPDVSLPLESICLKAMALKPEDRYPSVRRMARDIEQYLADESVSAHQESTAERIGRFGRRHRTLLLATAASLVLISLISVMATVVVNNQRMRAETLATSNRMLAEQESQARNDAERREQEATRARAEAEQARIRSDRVRTSLVEILRSPNPERDGRDVTVVEMLDSEIDRINDSFNDDPLLRSEMLRVIGETYLSLGLQTRALELAEQAAKLIEAVAPRDQLYALDAKEFLATALVRNGQFQKALPLCIQNHKDRVGYHGPDSEEPLRALQLLAEAHLGVNQTEKAIRLLESVLRRKRQRLGESNRQTMEAATSLARAYNSAKRFEDAIQIGERAHENQIEHLGNDDPLTLQTKTVLANAYSFAGRLDDAIRLHQQALEAKTSKLGPSHVATLESELSLALSFISANRANQAKPHIAHLSEMVSRESGLIGTDNALIEKVNFLVLLSRANMLGFLRGTEVLHTLSSVYTTSSYLESDIAGFLPSVPGARMKALGALTSGGRALQRIFRDTQAAANKATPAQVPETVGD